MKTKLITTITISLLVASSPICSANPAGSLIKAAKGVGKIIGKEVPKVTREVKVKQPRPLPKPSPTTPTRDSSSGYIPIIPPIYVNDDRNRKNDD